MLFKILSKIFKRTLQRLHCSRCKRTKRVAWTEVLCVKIQQFEIFCTTGTFVDGGQDTCRPGQAFAAGCAETTRFLSKKLFEVLHEAHGACFVVENDQCAGSQPAASRGYVGVIELHVKVLFYEEIRRRPSGQRAAE